MLALAGRRLDMRPACRPGEPIDFSEAYESACYLTEGWGQSEPNAGIWTLGAEARMLLIMDSAPAGAMRLRAQVTPFVAACHPALTVRVEVNGSPVGAWAFLAITTAVATQTLPFAAAFSAFTNDVIWLIVVSFFFARASCLTCKAALSIDQL